MRSPAGLRSSALPNRYTDGLRLPVSGQPARQTIGEIRREDRGPLCIEVLRILEVLLMPAYIRTAIIPKLRIIAIGQSAEGIKNSNPVGFQALHLDVLRRVNKKQLYAHILTHLECALKSLHSFRTCWPAYT